MLTELFRIAAIDREAIEFFKALTVEVKLTPSRLCFVPLRCETAVVVVKCTDTSSDPQPLQLLILCSSSSPAAPTAPAAPHALQATAQYIQCAASSKSVGD